MLTRTALIGLLAAAVAAILPAAATATVAPSLAITQGNGATAGSTTTTVLKVKFTNKGGDAPKAISVTFPPGFLLNFGQNEGQCLASSAPSPSCLLGYVEFATANEETSWDLYLVAPPTIGDVAGIALENESNAKLGIATVTLLTTPAIELNVGLPPFPTRNTEGSDNGGIVGTEIFLKSPRLPTACGAPLFFNLHATTFNETTGSANAPLEVTGCNTLPYAPKIAATVTKVTGEEGADVAITLTQPNPAGESATSGFEFGNPTGVKINNVLAPCFKGTTCTVGTVAASSPTLAPSELSTGELTLAGSINSGNLSAQITGAVTMSFPPPFQFSVNGPINTDEHTITFLDLPDFPLSSLTYNFLGVPAGPAFVTDCEPSTISATVSPRDGNPPVKVTGPVTNVNCPPPRKKPTASGSLSGLVFGRPKLSVHVRRASGGASLSSLSLELPAELSFSSKAISTHRTCKHGTCTKHVTVKGLSGVSLRSAHLSAGKLVLSFSHAAASVSLSARSPLLHESSSLERKVKNYKAGGLTVHLGVTDTSGKSTALSVG